MEYLLSHLITQLSSVTALKDVDVDDGQLDEKVSLKLPAAYVDITDMAYDQAGENIGMADTEITVKLAFSKKDTTRYSTINAVTRALVGTHGESFGNIMKETQKKVDRKDIFIYQITFGCMLYDEAAKPNYTLLEEDEKPEPVINFIIE